MCVCVRGARAHVCVFGVLWNPALSIGKDSIHSVNQAFHVGRGWRRPAKALLRKLE